MSMIQVETRPKTSSAAVSRLRNEGFLPMALIERGVGTRLVQAPVDDLREVLSTKEGLKIFPLKLDADREMRVVVKQIDRHDVTRKVINMVLQEVGDDDKIKISIPIEYSGTPRAVAKNQASLLIQMNSVDVQGQVKNLPDSIKVDLSALKQNDRILLGDLTMPEGLNPLASSETVLASTVQLRGMADFDDEAAIAAENA